MSNVIPFRPRLFTWPHTPIKEPRTEDMRLVVEAQLVAVRETDPIIRLQDSMVNLANAYHQARIELNKFGKTWKVVKS